MQGGLPLYPKSLDLGEKDMRNLWICGEIEETLDLGETQQKRLDLQGRAAPLLGLICSDPFAGSTGNQRGVYSHWVKPQWLRVPLEHPPQPKRRNKLNIQPPHM